MDPEPAARPDIGRHEEMFGLRPCVMILGAGRSNQPKSNAPVTVMVDYIRGKGLATHTKVGKAVRDDLLSLRKREANLPNRLVDTPGHTVRLPQHRPGS